MLGLTHFSHAYVLSFGPRFSAWRSISLWDFVAKTVGLLSIERSWYQQRDAEISSPHPAILPHAALSFKSKVASALEQSPEAKDSYWSELSRVSSLLLFNRKNKAFLVLLKQVVISSQNQWSIPCISFSQELQNPQVLVLSFMPLWFGPIPVFLCPRLFPVVFLDVTCISQFPELPISSLPHVEEWTVIKISTGVTLCLCFFLCFQMILCVALFLSFFILDLFSLLLPLDLQGTLTLRLNMWLLSVWKSPKDVSVVIVRDRKVFWGRLEVFCLDMNLYGLGISYGRMHPQPPTFFPPTH